MAFHAQAATLPALLTLLVVTAAQAQAAGTCSARSGLVLQLFA